MFRTEYDKLIQNLWCPKCNATSPFPGPPLHSSSFICSPGIGCHQDSRVPGYDTDGARYSNIQACRSNCSRQPSQPPRQ